MHMRYLLISCAYISIESIDCILLSSFELKAILLISSVKTLCLSLLNLCCVFNTSLFFMNYFLSSLRHQFLSFLNSLLYFQFYMLLSIFIVSKLKVSFSFFSLFLFYLHHYCLLNNYTFSVTNQQIFSLST